MHFIAVLPPGLEEEGCKELDELGAKRIVPMRRSVAFESDLACFYRLHLQARLPFRLLRQVARFQCHDPKDLYRGVREAFDWELWLHPSLTFRVDVSGTSACLPHSHYSALQVKNALIDLQREIWGIRSNINLEQPDLCLHLHLSDNEGVLSLDGSATSLHRRGYRSAMGSAPLKENLAAGLIRLSGWNGLSPLIDPVCGSGTLLIEAVSLIKGRPVNFNRHFTFENWLDFDPILWQKEKDKVNERPSLNFVNPYIIGCEEDPNVAEQARFNIRSAGLQNYIKIKNINFKNLIFPKEIGTIVCNPPYGKRVGFDKDLSLLYGQLGDCFKEKASGWDLWILSGNPTLTKSLRMKANKKIPISNGGIDCRWLNYSIN